ncbi:hypothetical protein AC481_00805 [miscellaneous Crenarchaeota group archaeon SMTZ-80]|nr:MAG: hypothetical protein AC481_00805 [miscellaneous Crenarchaeota group archaeon SMTZ-80]
MKPAIIIGCCETGLSIIRCLGREGIPVISAYFEKNDFTHYSKYALERVMVPSPKTRPDEFLKFLMKKRMEWNSCLLLSDNDDAVELLSRNKGLLSKSYVVGSAEWNVLEKFLDKSKTYALAKKLEIPVPKIYYPDSEEFLEKHKKDFVYPCLLKPFHAHKFIRHFKKKLFVIKNFEELKERFYMTQKREVRVMISEIIKGADDRLFSITTYISKDGEMLASLCRQKLRQNPPSFGVARIARTVEMIPEIKKIVSGSLERWVLKVMLIASSKRMILRGSTSSSRSMEGLSSLMVCMRKLESISLT